jgi:hypothetical protein
MTLFKAAGVLAASVAAAVAIAHMSEAGSKSQRQAPTSAAKRLPTDVSWPTGPVMNQGGVNGCAGFAVAGLVGGTREDAIRIYTLATRIDTFAGEYPAQDTGSSGPASMEAAKRLGYIKSYRWTKSSAKVLSELKRGPLVVGLQWPTKGEAGHAMVLVARHGDVLTLKNSWGAEFGDHGFLDMPVATFKAEFLDAAYVG